MIEYNIWKGLGFRVLVNDEVLVFNLFKLKLKDLTAIEKKPLQFGNVTVQNLLRSTVRFADQIYRT